MISRTKFAMTAAALTVAAAGFVPVSAEADRLQIAMHDMMPMQSNQSGAQPSQSGGMQGGMRGGMGTQSQGGMSGGTQGGMGMQQQPGGMSGGMQPGMGMQDDDHQQEMMRMRGMQPGMSVGPGRVDLTDRIEGRIAFMRAELHITDAQTQVWNSFAETLRSARKHLIEARGALTQTTPSARLEQHERHLTERLQALKDSRAAYQNLFAVLSDDQKRTAEELIVPFIATF